MLLDQLQKSAADSTRSAASVPRFLAEIVTMKKK